MLNTPTSKCASLCTYVRKVPLNSIHQLTQLEFKIPFDACAVLTFNLTGSKPTLTFPNWTVRETDGIQAELIADPSPPSRLQVLHPRIKSERGMDDGTL